MPLFFAIAGLVSAALAVAILSAPVLLVVLVIAAIRSARSPRPSGATAGALPPIGTQSTSASADTVFAALIADQWPSEAAALQQRGPSGNGNCAS